MSYDEELNDQEFAEFLKGRPVWRAFVNRELKGAPKGYRTAMQKWGPRRWLRVAIEGNERTITDLQRTLDDQLTYHHELLTAQEQLNDDDDQGRDHGGRSRRA